MQKALVTAIVVGAVFVLLMPLIVADGTLFPDSLYPYVVPKAVYARSTIEIMFGLWAVLALRHAEYRPPRSWILVLLAIWVAVGLLAAAFGVSPLRSLWSTYERMQGAVDLVHWLAFAVVVTSVVRSRATWRALLNVNLGVGLAIALIGVAQHYGIALLRYLEAAQRINSTLGNATYVGAFMMVNALIAGGFLVESFVRGDARAEAAAPPERRRGGARESRRRRARGGAAERSPARLPVLVGMSFFSPRLGRWLSRLPDLLFRRLFWAGTLALNLWALTLTGTRGALVGLVAGLVAVAIAYGLWGRLRAARAGAFAMLGALLLLALVVAFGRHTAPFQRLAESNVMARRVAALGLDDGSVKGRLVSARVGFQAFLTRPWLGWGPENYTVAYDRYVGAETFSESAESFDQAHNKVIEELTTRGAVGIVAYLSLWGMMTWVFVRRFRNRGAPEDMLTWAVAAATTAYFVQNLFLFDTPPTILQFFVLLSFVVYVEMGFDRGAPRARAAGRAPAGPAWWGGASARPHTWWALLAVAMALASLAVYHVNYRVYRGASAVLNTANPYISWDARLGYFETSIRAFPPLANYPRLILANQVAINWKTMTASEAGRAVQMVVAEGERALATEPQEWRIYYTLADVYRRAATLDPSLLVRARSLTEKAVALAPGRVEVYQGLAQQQFAEGDYAGAYDTIEKYLERSPGAAFHFEELLAAIAAARAGG